MQVTVENTSQLGRSMKVEVPAELVDSKVDKKIDELAKTIKIAGFRPGKVPSRVVKMHYGDSVRNDVIREVLNDSLRDAFVEQSVTPAASPDIEVIEKAEGKTLAYTAKFEVLPTIELVDFAGAPIIKEVVNIDDAVIDQTIEKLQKQHASYVDVDRPSAIGDQVIIDFEGYLDGEAFDGGAAKEVPLVLGSGSMIPGFEEGFTGVSAGDSLDVAATFPADYHAEHLANREAIFKSKVHKVQAAQLPDIAKLQELLGVEGDEAAFRAEVKDNLQREARDKLHGRTKQTIMEKLLELNSVEVPMTLVKQEVRAMQMQMLSRIKQQLEQGYRYDTLPNLDAENLEADAIKRVKLGLILSEVRKRYEIELDSDKVKEKIQEIAALFNNPSDIALMIAQDQERLAEIQEVVMEDQLVDTLLGMADVCEKEISYEEFVNA